MKIIDRIIVDDRAPENHNVLWIDTKDCSRVPKIYVCGEWRQLFAAKVEYGDIEGVSLVYGTIPRQGGQMQPELSYYQERDVYIDDILISHETIQEDAEITYTATYLDDNATVSEDGTVTCSQQNPNDTIRHIASIYATIRMNGRTTNTETVQIYQQAQTDSIPDYYIGFCSDHNVFNGYSDMQLFSNSRYHDSVDNIPKFPSEDGYVYFRSGEHVMYVLYNRQYTIRIDLDNPGSSMDPGDQSPEDIDMFGHESVSLNGKTYNVIATYDASYDTRNGFRFKLSR